MKNSIEQFFFVFTEVFKKHSIHNCNDSCVNSSVMDIEYMYTCNCVLLIIIIIILIIIIID